MFLQFEDYAVWLFICLFVKISFDKHLLSNSYDFRCIRFDKKRIVSGAYDGKIKIWDLQAALDPRKPLVSLCIKTLEVFEHEMLLHL